MYSKTFFAIFLNSFGLLMAIVKRTLLLIGYNIAYIHYENTPIQYTVTFHGCKNDNFQMKNCDIFSYFCSKH